MRGFMVVKKYLNNENVSIPVRATKFSAGYDLCSAKAEVLEPGDIKIIATGVKVIVGFNEYLQITMRSGISAKGLMLTNGVGIIDCDYYNNPDNEGEIFLPIINVGKFPFRIYPGMRLAQGIFKRYYFADHDSYRDETRVGGCGSTGD